MSSPRAGSFNPVAIFERQYPGLQGLRVELDLGTVIDPLAELQDECRRKHPIRCVSNSPYFAPERLWSKRPSDQTLVQDRRNNRVFYSLISGLHSPVKH